MFLFVVRHLRWLARVPLFPQIFDGLLLASISIIHPERVKAMERLEFEMLRLPSVSLRIHRLGGMEFFRKSGGELGHVHGHGLLDVRLERTEAARLVRNGRVQAHHVMPLAGWISFQLKSVHDVPFAVELLQASLRRKIAAARPRLLAAGH